MGTENILGQKLEQWQVPSTFSWGGIVPSLGEHCVGLDGLWLFWLRQRYTDYVLCSRTSQHKLGESYST